MPLLSYFPEYSRLQVCSFVLQSWFIPILRIHRLSTTPSVSRPHWPCFEAGHFQFYDYSRFSTAPSGSRPILSYDHAFLLVHPSFASKVTYGSVVSFRFQADSPVSHSAPDWPVSTLRQLCHSHGPAAVSSSHGVAYTLTAGAELATALPASRSLHLDQSSSHLINRLLAIFNT